MQMGVSKRLFFITLAMATAILVVSAVYASASLIRSGVSSGGGGVTRDGHTLRGVVGQPVAGSMADGGTLLCAGLACGGVRPASASETATVQVRNFVFDPAVVTITVGDTVTWVRVEGLHNVLADDGSFTSGPPNSTWISYSHTFTQAGSFPYYCQVHGGPGGVGMAGTVVVAGTATLPEPRIYVPLVTRQ